MMASCDKSDIWVKQFVVNFKFDQWQLYSWTHCRFNKSVQAMYVYVCMYLFIYFLFSSEQLFSKAMCIDFKHKLITLLLNS